MKNLRFSFEAIGKLTLRQRIAFMNAGLILGLGVILVLFINLAAPLFLTNEISIPNTIMLTTGTDAAGYPVTIIKETPAPAGYTVQRFESALPGDPLVVVKYLSVVGVILIGVIGFFASQWIARKSLEPVENISRTALSINVHNLRQRLDYQGAQDEVKDLAEAFDSMLQRLELNFKDQSEFNSNLAHELRTPLTSLRMNIEELASLPHKTQKDYYEFLGVTARSVDRMERLVNDLLLLSKGEKEILRLPVFLGVLFEEILNEVSPIASEYNISLKMSGEIELAILGDQILLHRMIANLVENGIFYNRPGGFVELSAHKRQDQIVIEVQDNGLGISSQQQMHLFKRFYRNPETTGHNGGGRGLGLAIAAHIANLHNGKISVNSTLGEGSTFRIEIPILFQPIDLA